MNVLEDDFTRNPFHTEFNFGIFPWEACLRPESFSEFHGEGSAKDALSDILKDTVQNISHWDT